jgi:hypothetical protein
MKKLLILALLLAGCSLSVTKTEKETCKYDWQYLKVIKTWCRDNADKHEMTQKDCMRYWGIDENP